MKTRLLFVVAALAVAGTVAAQAVDLNGKWTAQVPGRDGQTRETTFNFKVEADKVTGTISGPRGETPISDGKVQADEISFNVVMSFQGNEMKLVYKGKVAGDEIKFTRTREGADRSQEFTAKRAK
jgi:hypothetical protein